MKLIQKLFEYEVFTLKEYSQFMVARPGHVLRVVADCVQEENNGWFVVLELGKMDFKWLNFDFIA